MHFPTFSAMSVEQCLRDGSVDIRALLSEKNPSLAKKLPNFLYRYLERILHVSEVNGTIRSGKGLDGLAFAHHILVEFGVHYQVVGLEHLEKGQRYLLVSNHPLGGLDGIVLIDLIGSHLGKVYFPVNDLLLILPQFREIFLPINTARCRKRLHNNSTMPMPPQHKFFIFRLDSVLEKPIVG